MKLETGAKQSDAAIDLPPLSGGTRTRRLFVAAALRWPGVVVCLLVALAATFISEHHGGPSLLYALLIGLSINFLWDHDGLRPGITFCSRTALRVGVALLGARITLNQMSQIGVTTAAGVAAAVAATVLLGVALARLLGQDRDHGLISGAAVGICGASAALAVSTVLPATRENERFTLLTVVGVTILSTVAMVVYPLLLKYAGVPPQLAGMFMGGTIHDVAQVVAAGSILGATAADAAVITKLYRVALLAPVVLCIALVARRGSMSVSRIRVPLLPGFMVAFIALVAVGSTGAIPVSATKAATSMSQWLLIIAIAASGVKTRLQELAELGWRPLAMLLAETLFIASVVAVLLAFGRVL
ncbi:YeiH family protein [Hydrogenophaga sp. OTU3427]|uniref:YeiH family protein n=1 Tax=Hydrogenophaga sp. OTU3427 TaxID=3043856 RepID=UPI00313DE4B6